MKFGVSPFAVWRNASTDPAGSPTSAGIETYDDLYADTRLWVRGEWLDYIAPQVYWNIGYPPADYAKVVPWWTEPGARHQRPALRRPGRLQGRDVDPGPCVVGSAGDEQAPRLQQPAPEVRGDLYFSAKDVRANRLGYMDLVHDQYYAHPALVPRTAGVPGRAPARVTGLRAVRLDRGVRVSWLGHGSSYAVYRFAKSRIGSCDLADADHLVATVHAAAGTSAQVLVDRRAPRLMRPTYVVTALDRAYRESRPAQVTVRR